MRDHARLKVDLEKCQRDAGCSCGAIWVGVSAWKRVSAGIGGESACASPMLRDLWERLADRPSRSGVVSVHVYPGATAAAVLDCGSRPGITGMYCRLLSNSARFLLGLVSGITIFRAAKQPNFVFFLLGIALAYLSCTWAMRKWAAAWLAGMVCCSSLFLSCCHLSMYGRWFFCGRASLPGGDMFGTPVCRVRSTAAC